MHFTGGKNSNECTNFLGVRLTPPLNGTIGFNSIEVKKLMYLSGVMFTHPLNGNRIQ